MFNGIFSTPPIPFVKNKINFNLYNNFLKWQKNNGVGNVYLLGTWGGHGILNFEEKKRRKKNRFKI